MSIEPYAWQDRPALMEHLFPVQKISAESFKEQMAVGGKTLTALGSYWKGRKPLILGKACVLGVLLPATDNHLKDLEIFELLMGMDSYAIEKRLAANLPASKHHAIGEYLILPYSEQVKAAKRPEELDDILFEHIWETVNNHLGTTASTFPELIEQMGTARFGRRPRVADVFCGSGQIPFEAARLGCDVYASDLNPIACMLTWGAFNIVGASKKKWVEITEAQKKLAEVVQKEVDAIGIETDGKGWRAKVFLYCVEVKCPETGWMVPLMPTLIISKGYRVVARLVPVKEEKRYDIDIVYVETEEELELAKTGTITNGVMVHSPDGVTEYRIKISNIRGDYKDGQLNKNKLRLWEKSDFIPRPGDIFQERLYCVQWMRIKVSGNGVEYQFRAVTEEDLQRELKVIDYVGNNLTEWQEKGYVPDMVIEKGYNTDQPIRERGWTYWHHFFNARQLLIAAVINIKSNSYTKIGFFQVLNNNCRGSRWHNGGGGGGLTAGIFDNQALNKKKKGTEYTFSFIMQNYKRYTLDRLTYVKTHPAQDLATQNDIYITDPPYGDAVKYEEITEFFIAWLRKNPPPEFADWTWDSRRALAIKGEDEDFRRGMIEAYRQMARHMPDNGIQVVMFTHRSGAIWADMTNIIWASGLQVTAAWYVVTETDSALRQGANVTGTVLLVLRKRISDLESFRDELAWEIEGAVKTQVESLVGLNRTVREQRAEVLYTDADLQMAGYAAALKVLTSYSRIDGRAMVKEAEAPRITGRNTFVDEMIEFAVQTAVQFLVPDGFDKSDWQRLAAVERFYLKMADMEQQGLKTLDNYLNFARAFKVRHSDQLMSEKSKANAARLKLSTEFKSTFMSGDSEIASTTLRALLYALFEITKEVETDDVLLHLMENCANFLQVKPVLIKMADYLAEKRENLKPTKVFRPDLEASAARVLAEALRNQRL